MDINQVARMIEWLDEERRRDKAMIAKLEEQITQQQDVIDTMSRRVNSVETDQIATRNSIVNTVRESDLLDQLRVDMQQMVEAVEVKRLAAEREADRRNDVARENLTRPFREVYDRLDKLERLTEEIGPARVERD